MEAEVDRGAEEGARLPFRNGCGCSSATSTRLDPSAATAVVRGCNRRCLSSQSGKRGQQPSVGMGTTRKARRWRQRRRCRPAEAVAVGLFCCTRSGESALLHLDQMPDRITNQRSATFTYVCTMLDVVGSCDVQVNERMCKKRLRIPATVFLRG